MKTYYKSLLHIFKDESLYIQKKAEYTLLIMAFVYLYADLMFLIDIFLNHNFLLIGTQFSLITLAMGVFFILWKKKHLELATNLTVLLGFSFAIYLFNEPVTLRFYMQILMVMLVVTAGYIKSYQFIVTYTILGFLLIAKFAEEIFLSRIDPLFTVSWADKLYTIIGIIALILCFEFLKLISERELHSASELKRAMEKDELTNLPNRRKFNRMITTYVGSKSLVFLLIDLDHFKLVNDTYGHNLGDKVLIEFSTLLQHMIRPTDLAFRWGGEEFVVLLMDTNLTNGIEIAKRIRNDVENHTFESHIKLTISIGATYIPPNEDIKNLNLYFKHADYALYQAKNNGRNQLQIAPESQSFCTYS